MTRNLILLGIVLVVLGGGLTALGNDSSGAFPGVPTPVDEVESDTRPEPTATPEPEPTAEPESVTNRENCDEIRGTQYLSPDERTWYLANCVRR